MLPTNKVQSSENGKERLRQAMKEAKLTQMDIKNGISTSEDTIKRLLGSKDCPNGIERRTVEAIVNYINEEVSKKNGRPTVIIRVTDIVDSKDWFGEQLSLEFKSIITEKIRGFYGRHFVFEAFKKFLDNKNGYFTVVGDPGMGKSAIAAKYVADNHAICYFNIRVERRSRPELFLKSVRKQLISRYSLVNMEDADLPTLLAEVSRRISSSKPLVIVVDALDEVEQEPGENILYLPTTLPDHVYFLLTRRPYLPNTKRLNVSPGVAVEELDLTKSYVDSSHEDVKGCIRLFLDEDPNYGDALRTWIQNRNLTREEFAEQVASKSENNFMYLRYVLPAIARGFYDDLTLKQLPDGLQDYYQTHWVRMGMDDAPKEMKVIILFILVEIGTPIPCEVIADIAAQDKYDVQSILAEWVEYLKEEKVEEDICYSIYHTSFLDFLNKKRDLAATRNLFRDVNQRIVDYWEREMDADDDEEY